MATSTKNTVSDHLSDAGKAAQDAAKANEEAAKKAAEQASSYYRSTATEASEQASSYYLSTATKASEQFLNALKEAHERSLSTTSSLIDSMATNPILRPAFFGNVSPDPTGAAELYFKFAEDLLETQRNYTMRLTGVLRDAQNRS